MAPVSSVSGVGWPVGGGSGWSELDYCVAWNGFVGMKDCSVYSGIALEKEWE